MAHKLDPLLLMLFQHMHTRAASAAAGGAPRLWRACMTIFERVLQLSQRVKFTPYIRFMGARLAGVENARAFAAALVTRACTPVRTLAPVARCSVPEASTLFALLACRRRSVCACGVGSAPILRCYGHARRCIQALPGLRVWWIRVVRTQQQRW